MIVFTKIGVDKDKDLQKLFKFLFLVFKDKDKVTFVSHFPFLLFFLKTYLGGYSKSMHALREWEGSNPKVNRIEQGGETKSKTGVFFIPNVNRRFHDSQLLSSSHLLH